MIRRCQAGLLLAKKTFRRGFTIDHHGRQLVGMVDRRCIGLKAAAHCRCIVTDRVLPSMVQFRIKLEERERGRDRSLVVCHFH